MTVYDMSLEGIYGSERAGSADSVEPGGAATPRLCDPAGHRTDERRTRAAEHRHVVRCAGAFARREMDRAHQGTRQLTRKTSVPPDGGGATEPPNGSGAAETPHACSRAARGAEGDLTHAPVLPRTTASLSCRVPL